jgi:hypothetical protein
MHPERKLNPILQLCKADLRPIFCEAEKVRGNGCCRYGSDVMLRRGIPRPVCLAAAYLSLMAGCLLLATGFIQILYVGSALVGLAYGAFWSLFPCIISEVFGFKQFAAIYKTIV